jgi:hypothetical protein
MCGPNVSPKSSPTADGCTSKNNAWSAVAEKSASNDATSIEKMAA